MRIAAVNHVLPTRQITNDWILQSVRQHNRHRLTERQLDALDERIQRYLEATGTQIRYYLNEGEKALDLAVQAGHNALAQANISATDVDFLIYSSVGRGWIEPATAPAIQAALGLSNATCFDVLEACAGWLRGLHIAHSYIRTGTYRRGMIVNCECGLGQQAGWTFDTVEELEHRVAAYTIGEAATATIVDDHNPADDFYFRFKSSGEHVGLCMVPLSGVEQFHPGHVDDRYVAGRLFSLSQDLVEVVTSNIVELFRCDAQFHQRYDICFGHEVSERVCQAVTRTLGVHDVYFPTHRRFGNTVSASIPLGMSTALQEGKLERGGRVLIIVGASGVTVGLASFTF
jgi:3-oxoacyl-[acyl-carrier-protein] synthase III